MHFVKKKVAGKTYLSIAETHRVNGVPKTSIVKYVGSAEKLFKILIGLDKEETESHHRYQFCCAAGTTSDSRGDKTNRNNQSAHKEKGAGLLCRGIPSHYYPE
jgi:hypothetical protein